MEHCAQMFDVQFRLMLIHYFYLILFEKCVLKIYHLDPATFFPELGKAWQGDLKNTNMELELLELLIDIDMLLMVEKGIRGEIFYAIHRYTKDNNE